MNKYIALFFICIVLSCFTVSKAINLQQLENAIKSAGGISAEIVGAEVAAYLETAFQSSNFPFKNTNFSLSDTMLYIRTTTNIWGVPLQVSFTFTNATNLGLDLKFTGDITQFGGLEGIIKRVAPSEWQPELSQLVIADVQISVELQTSGSNTGLLLTGSVNIAPNGTYGQVLVALIKSYANPLSLSFTIPISSGKVQGLHASVVNIALPKIGKKMISSKAVGSIHFSFAVPGTYTIGTNIWINDIVVTVFVGTSESFQINANLVFLAGNQNVTFAGTGSFQLGQPITLTGTLQGQWKSPFGLGWITLNTGSFKIVIGTSPQISFQGGGALSFDQNTNVQIGLSIGAQGFVFAFTGVPVNDLGVIYQTVTGKNAPTVFGDVSVQVTAGIIIASFDDGQYQEGLTLEASTATISNPASPLLQAQKQLQPQAQAGSTKFVFKVFIPIFTPSEPVVLSLTYTNSLPLQTGLTCTEYQIIVSISASPSFVISGNFDVLPQGQNTPVTFSLSGSFVVGQSVTLAGRLTSPWNNAFGQKWLAIPSASGTLDLTASKNALSIFAQVVMTFQQDEPTTVTAELQSGDNFAQYCFSASIANRWNVTEIITAVAGTHLTTTNDVVAQSNVNYTFGMCNYAGGWVSNGVYLSVTGTIIGGLQQRLKAISPSQIPVLDFICTFEVPIFSTNPTAYNFYLNIKDNINIEPNLIFQQLIFIINNGDNAHAQLQVNFEANLNNNPGPIYFQLTGDVYESGAFTLQGIETGQWNDIFGIQGFDLKNVVCELGFSPVACTITGCVSDLGLGFTTVIGTKTITFAGNAASPNFLDTFIEGSVTAGPNGNLVLSVKDMALQWNSLVPAHQINMGNVPSGMGLKSAFISIAGQSGNFGPYAYEEGFHVKAIMDMISMTFAVDVSCQVSGLAPTCDFNFGVTVDFDAFYQELKNMIVIYVKEKYPDRPELLKFDWWSLNSVGMDQFATSLLSQGLNPLWSLEFTIWGSNKSLNFRSELQDLENTFSNFFNKYIKSIF